MPSASIWVSVSYVAAATYWLSCVFHGSIEFPVGNADIVKVFCPDFAVPDPAQPVAATRTDDPISDNAVRLNTLNSSTSTLTE